MKDRIDEKITRIIQFVNDEMDIDEVDDVFQYLFPIDCQKEQQGITTCQNAGKSHYCLCCKNNSNIPEKWRECDFFKPFSKH